MCTDNDFVHTRHAAIGMTGTSLNPDCYLNEVLGRGAVQHVDALITPGCRPATSTLSGINKYFMPSPLSMPTLNICQQQQLT